MIARDKASRLRFWEKLETGDSTEAPHADLRVSVQSIYDASGFRRYTDRVLMQMFADLRYVGIGSAGTGTSVSVNDIRGALDGRLSENVIREVALTLHSKLDKIRSKPQVITEGGDWELRHQAELLDKFLQGQFYELESYAQLSFGRLWALIVGTGFVKVFDDGRALKSEVVPSPELWVDPSEARYGTPRTLHHVKAIDRAVLLGMFPEFEEQIEKADTSSIEDTGLDFWGADPESDMLLVGETWHLRSSESAKDGRRVIWLPNVTLLNEEWSRDRFPFAKFNWSDRLYGYFGCGVAESSVGAQLELNRTMASRQEALHLLSAPFFLVEKGAKIVKSHLSNMIGRIIEYVGTEPKVVAPQAVHPELFEHGDRVKRQVFEQEGVSQLSATMQKPAGLNSGKALRTYNDMESERFVDALHRSEDFARDYALLLIEQARELYARKGELRVTYVGPDQLEDIDWQAADLPQQKYRLKIAPVSALSTTIAGKLQDLQDLRDLGILTDPGEMRDLLGMPDLEASKNRQLAHRNLLLKVIEKHILREGKYIEPEPMWDLALAVRLGVDAGLEAQLNGAPADKLDLLRQFVSAAQTMLTAVAPPALPPPGAGDAAALPPDQAIAPGAPPEVIPGEPLPGAMMQ